jgi:predicted PurR-regulated permease PerM
LPHTRRGLALIILATVAVVYLLEWAQDLVVSLLLGILFAYTLNPIVTWLERVRIPRVVGTTFVMLGVACTLVLGTYSLSGEVQRILDQVPEAANKLSAGLASMHSHGDNTMQKVQTAASQIEKATSEVTDAAPKPANSGARVLVDAPDFKLSNFLWSGSMGAAKMVIATAIVGFLTFFLLVSGDTYKRKLVRLSGPSLANKKITVHILDDINASIQRYMLMLLATNVLVGLLTWVALRWIGLENAGAWAVAAALLHLVPYLGPMVIAIGIGMGAFLQFNTFSMALLAAGASLAIATVVGSFVTTWMTGRIARMNTAAVFVALLFWAWLWGIWGMFLSIPITAIMKVVAGHVEQLQPIDELLGNQAKSVKPPEEAIKTKA